MRRTTVLLLMLTLAVWLSANMHFSPKITLVEMGADIGSNSQTQANVGMEIVEDDFSHNDLISIRYYNGEYGSPDITDMLNLIGVTTFPTVVVDRDATIAQGDETGASYLEQVGLRYWDASPVWVQVADFNQGTGGWSVNFTMEDEDLLLIDAPVQIILFEDFVDEDVTHVARQVEHSVITLGGAGSTENLTGTFDVTGYDGDYLHLLAIICDEQGNYLNAATDQMGSMLPDLQPAIPFDRDVVGPSWADTGNYIYNGEFFGVVNYGPEADFSADLATTNVPEGMSAMYCYEDSQGGSGCFNPAAGPFAFSLPQGDWIMFHLLIPQVTQACSFEYEFTFTSTTDRPDPLVIPFTFTTEELGVGDDGAPALSHLEQNRPNPFNPSTTIAFSMAQPGDVDLRVYDVRGRYVCTLATGAYGSGDHTVVWDGLNQNGVDVASGVYFYRLQANGETCTRKMLLMK